MHNSSNPSPFHYQLGHSVHITASEEFGLVIARSEHATCEHQYLIRYEDATGRATEQWWTQSALEDCEPMAGDTPVDHEQPTQAIAPDPLPTGQLDVPRIGAPWYGQGGIYAGIARGADGAPDHHLILSPAKPTGDVNWQAALAWAAKLVSGNQTDWALPNRVESALLFANLRDQFDKRYHWTSEAYADDDAYAWYQGFYYGGQGNNHKSYEAQARAVRRLTLQSFNPS
jgi:hypothetical protein